MAFGNKYNKNLVSNFSHGVQYKRIKPWRKYQTNGPKYLNTIGLEFDKSLNFIDAIMYPLLRTISNDEHIVPE